MTEEDEEDIIFYALLLLQASQEKKIILKKNELKRFDNISWKEVDSHPEIKELTESIKKEEELLRKCEALISTYTCKITER